MVQKVSILKDGTEQNPVYLNLDSNGNLGTTSTSSGAVTNAILTAVEDNITHTLGTQVKGVRASAALSTAHRASLIAPDLLGGVSTAPTAPTVADSGVTEGTTLLHAPTNYYAAYVIRNGSGMTMVSAISSACALANANSVRISIPAAFQIAGADVVYEIFFSTSATAPLHVSSFTAAQLAAGATVRCYDYTTVETPVLGGEGGAAWTCDIGIVGTGVATTVQRFLQSNAYTIGAVTPVNCAGYNNIDVYVDAQCTYVYSATTPSLVLIPFFLNDKQGANYHVGAPITVGISQATGQSYRQMFNLTVNSAYVAILVASISNVTVNRIDITPTSVV